MYLATDLPPDINISIKSLCFVYYWLQLSKSRYIEYNTTDDYYKYEKPNFLN